MRVRWLVVVGLLWVAGCSDGVDNEVRPLTDVLEASVDSSSTSSVSSATSSSSTTAAPTTVVSTTAVSDEWAIPDNPDAAYFERVLNELERLSTDVARTMLEERRFTASAEEIVRSTRGGADLDIVLDFWTTIDPFGETVELLMLESDPEVAQAQILEMTEGCVVVEATVSFDGVYSLPRDPAVTLYLLNAAVPDDLNPTGWRIHEGSIFGTLEDGCVSSS